MTPNPDPAPATIHGPAAVEVAILAALTPGAPPVQAVRVYVALSYTLPGLTYGEFWQALMALDRRGLVETAEIEGRGDDPPRVTVRCP